VTLIKKETWDTTPNLDLSKQINYVADIIVKDIKDGITQYSQDIKGKSFAPLKPATVKKKGHSKPLLDEGKMKDVYVKNRASSSSQKAEISNNIRDRRIPSVVHNEGNRTIPKREWFGVSTRAVKKANKYIKLEIERLMKL
jgi:phosphatidate phosphatase PAH1